MIKSENLKIQQKHSEILKEAISLINEHTDEQPDEFWLGLKSLENVINENIKFNESEYCKYKTKTILEEANDLIFNRSEEKERQYGNFSESMAYSAKLATILTGKPLTTKDFFLCMIALKLSRVKYNDKKDTYLDAIGYIAGLYDFVSKL